MPSEGRFSGFLSNSHRTRPSFDSRRSGFTRREVLAGMAAAAGALALGGTKAWASIPAFDHVVVVTMENRSFDHFFGWFGEAGGEQNFTYPVAGGGSLSTYPLAPDYQGCGLKDPDHSYAGGRIEYNGGACNGWLLDPNNDRFCIGYYNQSDLPFLGYAAQDWTTLGRYFCPIMASSIPNRIYQYAAQTDRIGDVLLPTLLPTIWDRLAARGISRRYYYSDLPVLALWGTKYLGISATVSQFLTDCQLGHLPAVSFVDPRLLGEAQGVSNDDHPFADIRAGEAFLYRIYQAVTASPNWGSTILIITFDEWGGFFDHVPPPRAPIPFIDWLAGNRDGLRGFRVPCVVISPWSHTMVSADTVFDHTSILRMIEARWGLAALTIRDATANNLGNVLSSSPVLSANRYSVPGGPFPGCASASTTTTSNTQSSTAPRSRRAWYELAERAKTAGWTIY
jgi:phospholipase C